MQSRTRTPASLLLLRAPLLVVALGAVGACAPGPAPLGSDALDGVRLSETPAAYLADALDQGDLQLQELVTQGETLTFAARPDPTSLLQSTNFLDDLRPRAGKVPVSVLSWNVALLDAQLLGFIDYKRTPTLEERRRALPELAFTDGADVICLQEVWREQDLDTFTARAQVHGYRAFAQERREHNDGVMVFVREDAIAGGTVPRLEHFEAYASQDGLEYFPGPSIKRGYLEVAFTHAQAGPARIFCTHMQAFPENWYGRLLQARELGIAARTHSADDELVLVAGDLNAGPFYKTATWLPPEGEEQTQWFHNALSYPLLLAWGGLVDAAILGRPAADAMADVLLGETVVNDAQSAVQIPGAAEGWCAQTPNTTFTATDCNALYFAQYAGTEYPARLDHIHVRPRDDLVVRRSTILFTEQQDFAGTAIEPSDHYGVRVELLVDPR